MDTKQQKTNHFLTGLLFGGVLGGAAALLLTPRSGREFRADITETGKKAIHETEAFLGKTGHQFSAARQRARDVWSCIKEKGETVPQYRTESVEESVGEA